MKTLYYSTGPTPFGDFTIGLDATGALAAAAFGGEPALQTRAPDLALVLAPDRTAAAWTQFAAYFENAAAAFQLALAPTGSAFQQRVWAALRRIPCGQTRSYGQLADELGSSARAVGRANATNPICVAIPCHRVIGADGSLTGYAFGEDLKRRLLEHEGVRLAGIADPTSGVAPGPARRRSRQPVGVEAR
jgi:methylated-DNA-[protein]-cysteine S-methyltransferase